MSAPNDPSAVPSVILVARRAASKPAAKPKASYSAGCIPWMKIAIGGTIAWQAVILVMALYFATRPETVAIANDDDFVRPARINNAQPIVKAPGPNLAEPKNDEAKDVVRIDDLDDLPVVKGEFIECAKVGTDIRFMKEPAEAFQRAKAEKKMVFMIHLSGNLDDKDFT